MLLASAGKADIGFSTIDPAYDGVVYAAAYQQAGPQDVKGDRPPYDSFLHVVSARMAYRHDRRPQRDGASPVGSVVRPRPSPTASSPPLIRPMARCQARQSPASAPIGRGAEGRQIETFFWIGGFDLGGAGPRLVSQPAVVSSPPALEATNAQTRYPGLYTPTTLPENTLAPDKARRWTARRRQCPADGGRGRGMAMVGDILAAIFDNLDAVHAIHPDAAKL